MAVKDSEKKTEAISDKRVEKGEELQQFQEAQGQLLNLQAEQRNNLNEQRVISGMEVQNNQTLAQAAEVLAASGGGAATIPQVSPKTSEILSKYGIKPGSNTKTQSNTIQTLSPQKVSITNNTTTTTTNNVQMSAPQIPISAPVIPMRAGAGGSDTERFKVWVSNAFAKQNEAAAIREKEYNKREWSLTRSTNKMIRKMGEIGKTFSESMNPKKLVGTINNQFKTLLFLMGLHLVSKNIKEILDWFRGESGLAKLLKTVFGEDFKIKNVFSDGITRLIDYFKLFFEERGKAIKAVEFPKIDLKEDLLSVVGKIGSYLGDVLGAAFSGTKSLTKSKIDNFKSEGRARSIEDYDDKYSHTQDIKKSGLDFGKESRGGIDMSDVSLGDLVTTSEGFKDNFKMASSDYDSFGSLSNNAGASIKQSKNIVNMFNRSLETGEAIDVGQYSAALTSLKKSAFKHKDGTMVSRRFMESLGVQLGLPNEVTYRIIRMMKTVQVRYIIIPKSDSEMSSENAGSFLSEAGKTYVEGKALESANVGGLVTSEREMLKDFSKGNYIEGITQAVVNRSGISWLAGKLGVRNELNAAISGTASSLRRLATDKYTIKAVQLGDPRYEKYETLYTKDGKVFVDEENNTYLLLTKDVIKQIEIAVSAQHDINFKFDSDELSNIEFLNKVLNEGTNSPDKHFQNLETDLGKIAEIDREINESREEMLERHSQDSISRLEFRGNNSGESNIYGVGSNNTTTTTESNSPNTNTILTKTSKNFADSLIKGGDGAVNKNLYGKDFTKNDMKQNTLEAMKFFSEDKELDLTPQQAAGIVGNLLGESSLNPKALNNIGASGIAQWLDRGSPRKSDYKKFAGVDKFPHEHGDLKTQLRYVKKELLSSEKIALKALKGGKQVYGSDSAKKLPSGKDRSTGSLADSTKIFRTQFERPGDAEAHDEARLGFAYGALKLYADKYNINIDEVNAQSNKKDGISRSEQLALKFTPTSGKGEKPEIIIGENSGESINPIADFDTAFGSFDEFAANQLRGSERAWYEMYHGKSRDELEKIFSDEGIKAPTKNLNAVDLSYWHKGLGGDNSSAMITVDSDGDFSKFFGKEMKFKEARKQFSDILSKEGLSGLTTKYLKDGVFKNAKTENEKYAAISIARTLLKKEDQENYNYEDAVKDLTEFTKTNLLDSNSPTLSSSTFYHTDEEQRAKLARVFMPKSMLSDKEIADYEKWENAFLGAAKNDDVVKERYNKEVFKSRNKVREKLVDEAKDKRDLAYLEEFIAKNLKDGESIKDGDNYNLNSVSSIVDTISKAWSDSEETISLFKDSYLGEDFYDSLGIKTSGEIKRKTYELPKPLEKTIKELLGKSEDDGSPLSDEEITKGFNLIKDKLENGTKEEKLKIAKNLVLTNKIHELGINAEELENISESDTIDFLQNLVMNNNDEDYLKTRLGIDSNTLKDIKNSLSSGDSVAKAGAIKVLKDTKLYKEAKATNDNYYSGQIAKARELKNVLIDDSMIHKNAEATLRELAGKPRILTSDTTNFELLHEMGKKVSSEDLPTLEVNQLQMQKNQEEILSSILRTLSINGYYSKVIAETNFDLLNVDIAQLNKKDIPPIISQSDTTVVSGTDVPM